MEEVSFLLSKPYTSAWILNSTPLKLLFFSAHKYAHLYLALSYLRAKSKHPPTNIHPFLATVPLALHNILSLLDTQTGLCLPGCLEVAFAAGTRCHYTLQALCFHWWQHPLLVLLLGHILHGVLLPTNHLHLAIPGTPNNVCDAETTPNMFLLIVASSSFSLLLHHHPDI